MAGVACHVGANARAARLAAASEILRADAQFTRDPIRSRRYDDVTASLQFELGEVAFNAAWAEGQAMTLEQVIVYAREEALD
jgi:hypothetical protein